MSLYAVVAPPTPTHTVRHYYANLVTDRAWMTFSQGCVLSELKRQCITAYKSQRYVWDNLLRYAGDPMCPPQAVRVQDDENDVPRQRAP